MTPPDDFSEYYADLLDGSYDCVDRLVLRAYCPPLQTGGGFRCWWRALEGSEDGLDNNHLRRMAGRFSRRLRAWAKSREIPVIYCKPGTRKHEIAEAHLPPDRDFVGMFLILVSKAPAVVYKVNRYKSGNCHLTKNYPFINHYSFHIMDRQWGHVTIIMAGHPPFNALVVLNGHEWVERQLRRRHVHVLKSGNCFTDFANACRVNETADALSADPRAVGRLFSVCQRWIYSACLCFGLSQERQERSRFRYQYSVHQAEYSRNLLFRRGRELDEVFEGFIDRTRQSLDLRKVTTIFGWKYRPQALKNDRRRRRPRFEVTVETLAYNLTVFKVHFGNLTLKVYAKGERVLRIEAIAHNVKALRCGNSLERFPQIVSLLRHMLIRFLNALRCADMAFLDQGLLEELPRPTVRGHRRLAGVDINQARMRAVLQALISLAPDPSGFSISQLASKVRQRSGWSEAEYGSRQAAYDLTKIRGKGLVERVPKRRRYRAVLSRFQAVCALLTIREKVLKPLVASAGDLRRARRGEPKKPAPIDIHYRDLQKRLRKTLHLLGIAA